ncbi:glycosyltransferase family 2 protein [Bacillus sp. KH172YL63]|uniref:glycosyltransferase family 2 protein n=1 Tax=Bacillus sp. KH172YL63 TaxID=2709784 RepID=UPI0013E4AD92|nr:glycosyltransferase family 2 protein [Bacillus sp. KH172YL63]BCB05758.1 putative teichuronic acid biosynthesis glycosyltransferase TuaG [Bacillus sp. KH172YL63]
MQEKQPFVSIITPTYNSEAYIKGTIDSVKNQTHQNWELIIVDDCSTDRTRDILNQEVDSDERIKVFFLESNSGAAVARNTAMKKAKGPYIAFLDADDQWLPKKLEKQIQFMEDNHYAFTFTQYSIMDQSGKDTGKIIEIPEEIDYHGLLKNTIIGFLTVMINVEKTGSVEMPNIRTRQDYAFELSILKKGFKAYGLKETLSKYRVVKGSISSNKVKAAKRNWQVYRKIEKLSLPYSIWCFLNYAFFAMKKRL